MSRSLLAAASVFGLFASMSAITAAPQTAQPGQMTPARIWVENRGKGQAVSVDLRDANLERPLKVHVTNGEPAEGSSAALPVRIVRQSWEYDTIVVGSASSMSQALNGRGAGGWEAIGIVNLKDDGATVLMKRPR